MVLLALEVLGWASLRALWLVDFYTLLYRGCNSLTSLARHQKSCVGNKT